ncbi:MAG: AfsA-related hotdog domain-containing protein [Solirubrobacteraceae bacterium]|nr:AfsA-related hotdog domain-containing protein [Patulibacter sp.]
MSAPTVPDQVRATDDAGALSFDRPVPRAQVHKTGPGEVFLTDYTQLDDDHFLVAAELPRSHAFYGDTASDTPGVDPITLLEIGRQCGYIVLHDHFGIALENTFVMRSMGAVLAPGAESVAIDGPARLHATLWLKTPYHRDGALVGFLGIATMTTVDGTPIGEVTASFSWITHDHFKAFRQATRAQLGLPAAIPPAAWHGEPAPEVAFGRTSARNAMLGELRHDGDTTTAYLRPDLGYVGVFDHAYDHVPGMAQTEGSKQLAVAGAAHRLGLRPDQVVPSDLHAVFHAINEVDWETTVTATFTPDEPSGGLRAVVVAQQNGRSLGEVTVLVTPRA